MQEVLDVESRGGGADMAPTENALKVTAVTE